MKGLVDLIRRIVAGNERVLARRALRRLQPTDADLRLFERELVGPVRPGDVVIGRFRRRGRRWANVRLPAEDLFRMHLADAGASGSGKSRWLLGVLLQALQWGKLSVVLFDAKSETARDVREVLLPYLIATTGDKSILDRVRDISPFNSASAAHLNLTQPEPGISAEVQAYGIVASIEEALAEPLVPRSRHVLLRLTCAAISLAEPLPRIQEWLTSPAAFLRAARHSPDAAVREYAWSGFPRENRESLRAVAARLNAFLFLPETRRALCAPGCVNFGDALDQVGGVTIVDVGSPPAGSEQLMKFWGGPLLGRITRAALGRRVTDSTTPALFIAEEIQEVVGAHEARSLARLLSVARFRKVAVWLTNQSRSQLLKVDRNLVEAIATNVGLQVQFRASHADAQAFAHLLPEAAGSTGAGATRRELVEQLTRLPRRHCYLALRDAPFRARLVLAPRFDLEPLRRRASDLPEYVRERLATLAAAGGEPAEESSAPGPDPLSSVPSLEDTVAPLEPEEPGPFPALG